MREEMIRIRSYDVLPDGSVKPSAMQRYMQQIARDDIAAYGATYEAMREQSMVFVITRLRMDFLSEIRDGDELLLKTFPYKVEGVTWFRSFEAYRNGERVMTADSRWVLLNFQTRSILRPSELRFEIPSSEITEEYPPIPRRISLAGTPFRESKRKIYLTQTDENCHLNNCVYSDLALDDAPIDLGGKRICTVCILFEREAVEGDTLTLRYEKTEDGFIASADNDSDGKPCFRTLFTLDF